MTYKNFTRTKTGRTVAVVALSAAIGGALVVSESTRPVFAAAETATMVAPQGGFADLVDAVRPAVVNVQVERAVRPSAYSHPQPPPGLNTPEPFQHRSPTPHYRRPGHPRAEGVGSGFIIDASGLIVTNHHVVERATSVTVTLQDGRKLEARVLGTDPKTDLALLEIDTTDALPTVGFGDSDTTRIGDWVVAVGNPFGLGGTVTAGIVSARGRDLGAGPYDDYLQVDAPINRGNSGGPLFDRGGRVVGVNSAIFSPTGGNVGIGFAIPASIAEPVIESLRTDGKVERGLLGIGIQRIDELLAEAIGLDETKGAIVVSVTDDGPAAQAGLRPGDVITVFAGQPIDVMKDLPTIVAKSAPGTKVVIEILRDGRHQTITATVGEQEQEAVATAATAQDNNRVRLGVALGPRTEPGEAGVRITDVLPDTPAARGGLRSGDVIVRAGNQETNQPTAVIDAVQAAATADKPLLLLVERDAERRYIAIELDRG